jgi:HSP90 family molecular chaperone
MSSPAIIVDHESAAVHKMQAYMESSTGLPKTQSKQKLEINVKHPILKGLISLLVMHLFVLLQIYIQKRNLIKSLSKPR